MSTWDHCPICKSRKKEIKERLEEKYGPRNKYKVIMKQRTRIKEVETVCK